MAIRQFLKNTQAEMKHVVWPGRRRTILFTVTVIVASVGVAYLLGAFDLLFTYALKTLLF